MRSPEPINWKDLEEAKMPSTLKPGLHRFAAPTDMEMTVIGGDGQCVVKDSVHGHWQSVGVGVTLKIPEGTDLEVQVYGCGVIYTTKPDIVFGDGYVN